MWGELPSQYTSCVGLPVLQTPNPCANFTGQSYIDCVKGLITPTAPSQPFYVPCSVAGPLNVRKEPHLYSPVVVTIANPGGYQFQASAFTADSSLSQPPYSLAGTGWYKVNTVPEGWVYDSNLKSGTSSSCGGLPPSPATPTPTPTPVVTPTPNANVLSVSDLSQVINCEAARVGLSGSGIGHVIYNRMTSGSTAFGGYNNASDIVRYTGVDCYPSNYVGYGTTPESDAAAKWLNGQGSVPSVNPDIDARAYYWLGVPTGMDLESTFNYIVNNPQLYNYGSCGGNESADIRKTRLRTRDVAIDTTEKSLTTIYFSLNPLCEQ